ncbi:hypothetical protein [Kushneria konosiri]|uniref:hypothetical protein n=1 Tax=Kushneria konosiri TaxID=698828 RepID=UPI0011E4CBF8|nr:hypothetical protein [Kushneria konosiri]
MHTTNMSYNSGEKQSQSQEAQGSKRFPAISDPATLSTRVMKPTIRSEFTIRDDAANRLQGYKKTALMAVSFIDIAVGAIRNGAG